MAKTYRLTTARRLANWLIKGLLRLGVAGKMTYLLTVKGRRSGRLYSAPVNVIEHGNQRWLVAPYGAVNWVRNARAAGQVTLTRGRRSETVRIGQQSAQGTTRAQARALAVVLATGGRTRQRTTRKAAHHPSARL
jgi:deazaflavin-dependent oxidoreductase (nitroreductase family)